MIEYQSFKENPLIPYIAPEIEKRIGLGSFYLDLTTHVFNVSQGILDIFEYDEKDFNGLNIIARIDELDVDYVRAKIQDVFDADVEDVIADYTIHFDGYSKRLKHENYLVRNEDGEVIGRSGYIRDITEKYNANKKLHEKMEELDSLNENLKSFIYIASHDLQEPVRKIIIFSDLLKQSFLDQNYEETELFISKISKSAKNMKILIEDLLEYSKVNSYNINPQKICLNNILSSALEELEIKIKENPQIKIDVADLPNIYGLPIQLKQLFINLISNAIKFSKQGEENSIRIYTRPLEKEKHPDFDFKSNTQYVEIIVEDKGIGFSMEFADKIYEPFKRLNTAKDYSGTGIGLSICKRIIDNHNGLIKTYSEINKGSQFIIILPFK